MLKLSRKKKNTWLALAVAASIMGGGTVFAAETADYTDTITGDSDLDSAYADVIKDGVYTFTQDTQISHNKFAINLMESATINAEGKTLTLNVKNAKSSGFGIHLSQPNTLYIKANTVQMDLKGTGIGDDGLQGVRLNNTDAKLTVDGNMDINANGTNNTMGIYTKGNIVVNGNVKTNINGNGGGNKYYGAAGIYVSSNYNDTKGGSVTINGNVDLLGNANGLFVNMGGSKINVDGGKIEVFDISGNGYAAIRAENGIVNMNVLQDEKGNVTGAGNNKVNINGNLGVSTGAVFASDKHGTKSEINLGLTTKDSVLTGVVENTFNDDGNKAGNYTFTGAVNLWLQNGATWKNEKVGTTLGDLEDSIEEFAGSHVAKLSGGNDADHAGNIFQKTTETLTIDNYSGHTNIFYAHTGSGESKGHYAAGETIIKHAEAGSVVNLITGNNDVKMTDENSVNKVLNALANKLTYSNFTKDENNLKGYVKIADGLTASSAAKIYGDITFNADGKGTCSGAVKPEPVEPPKTDFTTVLTGDTAADKEYAGNIKDGKYIFNGDSTITAKSATAIDVKAPLTIDAGDYQLVVEGKGFEWKFIPATFNQNVEGTTSITAGELVIGNAKNQMARSGITVNKGTVDIKANAKVYAYGDEAENSAYGILAQNNGSAVNIHGNLELVTTGTLLTSGLVAESTQEVGKGSTITVDGKADINVKNGNAISAIRNGSAVSVGGGTIQMAENKDKEYYALKADGGVVNVNMNADKNAAGTANTVIKGNISAYSDLAAKKEDYSGKDSTINIGISGKKSSWTGVAFVNDIDGGWLKYNGIANLYVSNGATWNNQAWGKTADAFEGSHITKLAGGASKETAGIIRQNDVNNITIDNYSGNMKLIYQGNKGTNTFAGGDTVIKSAVAGSYILVIGENTGINVTDADAVSDSLNALAGKLYYTGYVGQKENNLTGQVQLASGLTGSSQSTELKDITFSEEDGKGSTGSGTILPPAEQTKDTFTTEITGLKQSVYMNGGVQKEDNSYIFIKDTTIKVNQMTFKEKVADSQYADDYIISGAAVQNGKGVKDLVIKAEDKTLKLNVALDDNTTPPNPAPGILTNRLPLRGIDNSIAGSTTNVTAGTLDINVDNTYSRKSGQNKLIDPSSAIGIYANSTGEKAAVIVNGNTAIKAHGHNNVYGVNANGNSEIKLHGDLTMAKNGDKWAIENVINGDVTTALGEASWRNIAGINAYGAGASVTVDGKTTIAANGSGVVAVDGGTVNLGAADIEIDNSDEKWYHYHALGAALGTVNIGDEGKTVTIKGNAGLFGKQDQKFASDSKESVINLKLTTKDSAWTGVAYKHFSDAEKEAGLSGSMNLTLANGASWTNEKYGYTYGDGETDKYKFTGSEIANFVGSASGAKAGNIFQNDSNSLTIDSYSGNTNIFYAHTGNGEAAENYAAGDTIIKHAAEGSVVSLITNSEGVNMKSDDSVANVLNALAGKLTYSNFANEKNLTGFVKIADGLTASSKELKKGDIAFSTEDGKGSLKKEDVKPEPPIPEPSVKEYTNTLTGADYIDAAYADVIKDGVYTFTQDTKITHKQYGIELMENAQINAEGKTLTLNVQDVTGVPGAGIKIDDAKANTLDIKAGTVKMNLDGSKVGNGGLKGVNITVGTAKLTVDGNMDITVNGDNDTIGIYNRGNVVVNGDVKLNVDGNNGGWEYYGASGLYATSSMGSSNGGNITINGNIDFQGNANGLYANAGGSVINVNGGNIIVKEGQTQEYAAIRAANGVVNMNVVRNAEGNVTGAGTNDVTIKGNLSVDTATTNANDKHGTKSEINLGLTTDKSSLTGVIQNCFADEGKKLGDLIFTGAANLWLQNGATWNNEVVDKIATKPYNGIEWSGSHVTNFVGGASEAKAGNIFQNDANNITIDNYSGNTNIFYAHTGNGEAASDYAAGDTVIKHAEKDSVVSLITDNTGVAMDNKDSVANVLNALAGKLTYSNFANEKNLTGFVKIADGLTASSKELKKGDIAFKEDGKGSLKKEDVKPEPPTPTVPSEFNQGITGDAAKDTAYADVIKDGKYVFEKDTEITVTSGAAVKAAGKDVTIDNSNSKLVLKGYSYGINAEGNTVNINGVTEISSSGALNPAINVAVGGNVILDNGATINGNIEGFMGGNISINKNEKPATTIINGDIKLDGCSADIALVDSDSKLTGSYELENSTLKLTIKDKAVWDFKGGKGNGLTLVGGKTEAASGFIIMNDAPGGATTYSLRAVPPSASGMTIDKYSGWETFIYAHNNDGDEVSDYTSGDVIIKKADASSGVILSTDNSGINMKDKDAVEATLKALAQKITYKDHEANSGNLTGKVQIAGGLTASSNALNIGDMLWDGNGKGQYKDGSVSWNPGTEGPGTGGPGTEAPGTGDPGTGGPGTGGDNSNKIIEGDYETFVMKGVRSAATTSLHTWRDNMQDTYTGADMADEDGMFAKALGGKTSSDVKGLKDSNTYYGVQVGYDKAAANGWHTGVAFDYRNGDSNYLLGGKGDNQMYSLGVYGVKNFENDAFFRVAAKVGRVQNEYDVYNEIRSLKLNGDYKANAYGLTMEYGKTFGDEEAYFTPKAQLTWSQVGAKDYTAHTDNATMQISQDSYSSFVGRLGFEAGVKSEKGHVYAGLFAAHEFNGDISASYFANDGDRKHTSFDGEETWMEMKLGGSYDFSKTAHLYADIAKDFGGNFERKWKLNAGLRFEF